MTHVPLHYDGRWRESSSLHLPLFSPSSFVSPITLTLPPHLTHPPTPHPHPTQVADMLPAKKQRYKSTITDLSPKDKTVTLADGSKIKYNKVV